jgi:hypothetical protein
MRSFIAAVIGVTGSLAPPAADAALNQIARETGRLLAPAPLERDGFGVAVASNATHLVIGAPGFLNAPDLEPFGSVHVFERRSGGNPWLVRSIDGPRDSTDRRFGVSLAMGAGFFAVGSSNHFDKTDNPRAVLDIHEMDHPVPGSWGRAARIELGSSNLLSADQIISVASDGVGVFAGFPAMESVLLVERGNSGGANWQVAATIKAPDGALFDNFGKAVAVQGDWLAVGAPFDDDRGSDKGAVYLFQRSGGSWSFAQKLLAPAASTGSWLGGRLSLDGEWLAASDVAGDIQLFRRGGDGVWSFAQRISGVYDYHGFDLKGGELLCGLASASSGSTSSGRGELFGLAAGAGTWQKLAELHPSQPQAYGLVGGSARIDEQGYYLGSGYFSTSTGGTLPRGTCHLFSRPVLETYEGWALRVLPPALIGTAQADPDAILNPLQVKNRLCYAMGLDPLAPDPAALPRIGFDPLDQRWGVRFQIRPNAADYSWRVASASDLKTWTVFNGTLAGIDYGDGVQRQFRKLPAGTAGPRFFRVEVTPLSD